MIVLLGNGHTSHLDSLDVHKCDVQLICSRSSCPSSLLTFLESFFDDPYPTVYVGGTDIRFL